MMRSKLSTTYITHGAAALALFVLSGCGEVTNAPEECTMRAWKPVTLANASFDQDGGWTIEPLTNSPICEPGTFGVPADSGDIAACFGVVNQANQTLTQAVELPPGTTQVRLRGKQCLVTTEPEDVAKDTLVIEIKDEATLQSVAVLASWSNVDAGAVCAWEPFELMAPVTGTPESPMLSMHAVLDDLEITTFFLDTLELDAYGC
jgi:hypothetical protein